MTNSAQEIMFLVVDRWSGRVLDASKVKAEYSWSIRDAIETMISDHDLNTVDILIRNPTRTAASRDVELREQEVQQPPTVEPATPIATADDDVPF